MPFFQQTSRDMEPEMIPSRITLFSVRVFEDAEKTVDCMKDSGCLIINLEAADPNQQQRILDYLFGASQALSLQMKQIARNAWTVVSEALFSSEGDLTF